MWEKLKEGGQSLVEYALLLVLGGIVVIAVVSLMGEEIQKAYCKIIYALNPGADIELCESIDVVCVVDDVGSSYIRMHADVTDNAGDSSDIVRVDFFYDGKYINTEYAPVYCIAGDNSLPCQKYTPPAGPGTYEFSAIAYDTEGNSGSCVVTRAIP
jgi:Flp pilus assembly pilin Flp